MTFSARVHKASAKWGNTLLYEDVFRHPPLTHNTQLTHMQSFNQIARGGDKTSRKNKIQELRKGGVGGG